MFKNNILEEIIKSYKLVYPLEKTDALGEINENLECDKGEKIKKLFTFLDNLQKEEKVHFIFRGQKKEKLKQILITDLESHQDSKLFNKLFFFGEKAKYFFKSGVLEKYDSKSRFNQYGERHLPRIHEFTQQDCDYIYKELHRTINNENDRIKIFRECNKDFCEVINKDNNIFSQLIQLESDKERIKLRDYYLYLLHTFGKIGFRESSFFVSTSFNKQKSEDFAKKEEASYPNSEPVVYVYIIDKPFYQHGISLSIVHGINEKYSNTKIPLYYITSYPEQIEMAIKGCLFPHQILGIYDLNKKRFILNPHIFKPENKDIYNKSRFQGFSIDQGNLKGFLSSTNYEGYMLKLEDIYTNFSH